MGSTKEFLRNNRFPIACYLLSTTVFLLATHWGLDYVAHADPTDPPPDQKNDIAHRWDARWYLGIAEFGYQYTGEEPENVAFFPLYPLLVVAMSSLGIPLGWSGFIISHLSFLAALLVFWAYVKQRFPGESQLQVCTLLAVVLFPAGLYFRFVYTESLFLLTVVSAMYLMQCRRSLLSIALAIGLSTATRSVGIVLVVPFLMYIWERAPRKTLLPNLLRFVPLSCSGLLLYMAFQLVQFDEPFAFVKVQQYWNLRPSFSIADTLFASASWEPIWSAYVPTSTVYWMKLDSHPWPILNMSFWNPIAFLAGCGLTYFGYIKSWVNRSEATLAMGLLLIPYFSRGFDFGMLSQARFASVVFPAHIAFAHCIDRLPRLLKLILLVSMTLLLFFLTARFAAGYPLV